MSKFKTECAVCGIQLEATEDNIKKGCAIGEPTCITEDDCQDKEARKNHLEMMEDEADE